MGVNLSRSTVYFFKHNDMADLRLILASIAEDDVANRRDSTQQRRFIVVEGIYRNTGAICPLKELIELKEQYKYRLILDESLSFGVLGASGRGITEHFHLPPDAVEILTIAMDCSLASVGGVCVGTREIVDHQRLAGAGYCFSAAAPPFLSAVAIATLDELQRSSAAVDSLRKLVPRFHTMLEKVRGLTRLSSCSTCTPVVHLVFAERIGDPQEEEERMRTLETTLLRRGVAACSPTYPPDAKSRLLKSSTFCYRPSLRLLLHAQLTDADLTFAISVLQSAVDKVLLPPKSPGAVGDRGDDSRRIPNQ